MILSAIAAKLKQRAKADFKGRHYEAALIVQAVSWYLRYPLSYRDIEELLLERGLEVDHSTVNRWVLAYAPLIERRLRPFRKPHCGSVRVDETVRRVFVRCSDPLAVCPFAEGGAVEEGLPVLTVDEEIYRLVPAFVIATVDKFARLARENDYHNFIFSMKASNPKVMIEAYRLLVARLDAAKPLVAPRSVCWQKLSA